ncbi:ras family-domain-containing protein [Calycina marina]|uniref:Ras family-domain-containing protein n=1 Tax=Calycina marina TaxID=1763456 RepID=A0A9P7YVF0_9HELO|nr:ras family-domain-containing protein [Calycina marina]
MAKKPYVCKVAVLGDGGVGKTALISRLRFKEFVIESDPTIEDSCTIDVVVDDQQCTFEILDTAGVDEYSNLIDGWIRGNDGFILVYSISSRLSFARIQGLYDQIQQIKKLNHPHINSQVPITLVGNKVDITKRMVSFLEGKDMARNLGCAFLEASAKDGGNFEESLFCTIARHLQWGDLLSRLEDELSRSAIANTRPLVPVLPLEEKVRPGLWPKLATLNVPRFAKRQRSFPGIKYFKISSPQSLASQNQKANSVGRGMSQPSKHPGHSMPNGYYDHQLQKIFEDISVFLSRLGKKIRDFERNEKADELRARMEDIENNCNDGGIGSKIRHNEVSSAAERVGKMRKVQEVKLALGECQSLCEDASHKVMRDEECRENIQIKKEFVRMIEIQVSL